MSAILGGLFNSRLNMKLREEKGYTYGAGAGFDMRRGAGPFAARAAVNTEVTVPASSTCSPSSTRMRDAPVERRRARGRPRLPHRRLPAAVRDRRRRSSGRSAGLVVHGLPDDELVGYRPRDRGRRRRRPSRAAARDHIRPRAGGDRPRRRRRRVRPGPRGGRPRPHRHRTGRRRRRADGAVGLAAAVAIEEDAGPDDAGRSTRAGTGPTAGAEEPSLPGSARRAGDRGRPEAPTPA